MWLLGVGMAVLLLWAVWRLYTSPAGYGCKASEGFTQPQPNILFFDAAKAAAMFKAIPDFTAHVQTMSFREAQARSAGFVTDAALFRDQMREAYVRGLRTFTDAEKDAIRRAIQSNDVFPKYPWSLIKLDKSIDFGRSYSVVLGTATAPLAAGPGGATTTGEAVIMLSSAATDLILAAPEDEAGLLAEPLLFVLQQKDPIKFIDAYTDFGFRAVKAVRLAADVKDEVYTDPNCTDIRWINKHNGVDYWFSLALPVRPPVSASAEAFENRSIKKTVGPVGRAYPARDAGGGIYDVAGQPRDPEDFRDSFEGIDELHHPFAMLASQPPAQLVFA